MIHAVVALAVVAAAPDAPISQPLDGAAAVGVLLDVGRVMARPLRFRSKDLWVWAPAAALTTATLIFDVEIHAKLRGAREPLMFRHRISYWGSFLGDGAVDLGLIALAGALDAENGQRIFLEGAEALAATAILSRAAKLAFRLERPSADADRKHWFGRLAADAMPSGHAMSAFAVATVIACEYPRLAPWVMALATYVGIARVQQSAHWASDVVVGTAFGILFGWGAVELPPKKFHLTAAPIVLGGGGGVTFVGVF